MSRQFHCQPPEGPSTNVATSLGISIAEHPWGHTSCGQAPLLPKKLSSAQLALGLKPCCPAKTVQRAAHLRLVEVGMVAAGLYLKSFLSAFRLMSTVAGLYVWYSYRFLLTF